MQGGMRHVHTCAVCVYACGKGAGNAAGRRFAGLGQRRLGLCADGALRWCGAQGSQWLAQRSGRAALRRLQQGRVHNFLYGSGTGRSAWGGTRSTALRALSHCMPTCPPLTHPVSDALPVGRASERGRRGLHAKIAHPAQVQRGTLASHAGCLLWYQVGCSCICARPLVWASGSASYWVIKTPNESSSGSSVDYYALPAHLRPSRSCCPSKTQRTPLPLCCW